MESASLDHGTKHIRNTCPNTGCGGVAIVPVMCACCSRVLIKEEGVPRVLTGPAKKIKLEFDPELFIKKEAPEPSSPAPDPTQQEDQNMLKKRGGEKIVFKEENVDNGNKREKEGTLSRPSSASSFNFTKPKANFGQFKRPFKNNYRGAFQYNHPHYYRNNNYRNNSNSNLYAGNNMYYRNNGYNGGFRGGFAYNVPHVMHQMFSSQRPNIASVPLRSPLPIKPPVSPFNSHIKTPSCSPVPTLPPFQYLPSSSNVKRNVMSSVIPDPPKGQSHATSQESQTSRSWWKASEGSNKSSTSPANSTDTEKVKLNISSSSIPVSEIPSLSKTDKTRTKIFIGKDNGLHMQRASSCCAGRSVAKNSQTLSEVVNDEENNDQAPADNDVDDKDWIEELALEAVIPVKALCSSCLHSSEPKHEDVGTANSDVEILFNSCDIQICSEEGSGISRKGPRRPSIFKKTVEVFDVTDFNDDDLEDITPDMRSTISKKKMPAKRLNCSAFNTEKLNGNDCVVDIIEDEELNHQQQENRRTKENDSISGVHSEFIFDVLDVGEDIVLDDLHSNGIEENLSSNSNRPDEPLEEQEQTYDENNQKAGNGTDRGEELLTEGEVKPETIVDVVDINKEITLYSESTGIDTSVGHPTDSVQSLPTDGTGVVSNEKWDEVLFDMQEIGDEVEELVDVDGPKDASLVKEYKGAKESQEDNEVCEEANSDHERESKGEMGVQNELADDDEDIQYVGGDASVVTVSSEVVGSTVVSIKSDNSDDFTTLLEETGDNASSISDRKLTVTKASDLGRPRTLRKYTRSSGPCTPVRLTRSLRKSSLRHDSNTDTNDTITVDDSVQLVTSFLSFSKQPTSSQPSLPSEKSIGTPSRRSSRLNKHESNVLDAASVTTVEDDETHMDQVTIVSNHEKSMDVARIASLDAVSKKLPVHSRTMLWKIAQKTPKALPCITEASSSSQEICDGHFSTAATPGSGVQEIDLSKRTETRRSNAVSCRETTSSKQSSAVSQIGSVMTRRSMVVRSKVAVPLDTAEVVGCDQPVSSMDGISENVEEGGNELCSEYDLDYEEDSQESEVKSKDDAVEKSVKDLPFDDDDGVACLD